MTQPSGRVGSIDSPITPMMLQRVGDEALPGEPLVTEVGVALDRLAQIQSPATGCGLKPVDGDGPSAGEFPATSPARCWPWFPFLSTRRTGGASWYREGCGLLARLRPYPIRTNPGSP